MVSSPRSSGITSSLWQRQPRRTAEYEPTRLSLTSASVVHMASSACLAIFKHKRTAARMTELGASACADDAGALRLRALSVGESTADEEFSVVALSSRRSDASR